MNLHQLILEATNKDEKLYLVMAFTDDDELEIGYEELVEVVIKKTGLEIKYLRQPSHTGGWPEYLVSGTLAQFKKLARFYHMSWADFSEMEGTPKASKKEAVSGTVEDFDRSDHRSGEFMQMAGKSPLQKLAGGDSPEMQALQKKIADKLAKKNKE